MRLENNIRTAITTRLVREIPSIRWFLALTNLSVIFTFVLVLVGGVVRVSGSGLGCPDWPLCHGRVVPPLEFTALMEYSHRMMAFLTSLLVVALGILTVFRFRAYRSLLILGLLPAIVMILQVGLGGITVLTELSPTVVTVHMAVAALMLGILIVGTVAVGDSVSGNKRFPSDTIEEQGLWQLALFTAVGVYILGILGAYVRSSGASAACLTWPLCHGDILPSGNLFAIHMVHRFAAGIVGMSIFALVVQCWKNRTFHTWLSPVSVFLAAFFLAQVLTGAAIAWTSLSPAFRSLHLAIGMATWGASVALVTLVRPRCLIAVIQSGTSASSKAASL